MPFWLLLMAWVVLGERLGRLQWLAVGVAFCGLILVLSPWRLTGLESSLLAVAAGFVWAASAVVAKILQRRREVDLLSLTAWQMLLGSVPLIVIASLPLPRGRRSGRLRLSGRWPTTFCWPTPWAGSSWLYALRVLSAGRAGLGTLATPVVGVVAAWIQLGERPSAVETIGMALIVAALGIVTLAQAIAEQLKQRSAEIGLHR